MKALVQDVDDDVNRLYNALRNGQMNTARILYDHLRKVHKLNAKSIRESVRTLGLKKIVEVTKGRDE